MICPTCKLAGEMNRDGNTEMSKRYHKKCEWRNGGCFCQHAVGGNRYERK